MRNRCDNVGRSKKTGTAQMSKSTIGLLTKEMGEWAHKVRLDSNNPVTPTTTTRTCRRTYTIAPVGSREIVTPEKAFVAASPQTTYRSGLF